MSGEEVAVMEVVVADSVVEQEDEVVEQEEVVVVPLVGSVVGLEDEREAVVCFGGAGAGGCRVGGCWCRRRRGRDVTAWYSGWFTQLRRWFCCVGFTG
jgi:hypothetical protein